MHWIFQSFKIVWLGKIRCEPNAKKPQTRSSHGPRCSDDALRKQSPSNQQKSWKSAQEACEKQKKSCESMQKELDSILRILIGRSWTFYWVWKCKYKNRRKPFDQGMTLSFRRLSHIWWEKHWEYSYAQALRLITTGCGKSFLFRQKQKRSRKKQKKGEHHVVNELLFVPLLTSKAGKYHMEFFKRVDQICKHSNFLLQDTHIFWECLKLQDITLPRGTENFWITQMSLLPDQHL